MKKRLLFCVFCLPFTGTAQSAEIQENLEKIITYTQNASVFRNTVEWDSVKAGIYRLAQHAATIPDLAPAIKYMLKAIGDEHGRVFYQNKTLAWYYADQPKDHQQTLNIGQYNKIQSGQVYPFVARLLPEKTGYIRIVGLPMGDNEKMAKEIQDQVCTLIQQGAANWIIDLRYNGGGNLNPMAEGLAAIIGDGNAGGASGLTEQQSFRWTFTNGDFYNGDYSIQLKNDCTLPAPSKVAVLTSVYTASSGEALAVMFKGRPNTRFFGEKTLGMVTGTDWELISDDIAVSISVNYYRDRLGNLYQHFVDVDEVVPFVPDQPVETDNAVRKAAEWIGNR